MSFGSAFCLGKGALCNTCQHQMVVPGLHVSAAFRDRRHKTVIYLSAFSLPPDAPFAATASPSLPNRSLLRGCAAAVKKLSSNANVPAAQSSQRSLHVP